MKTLVSTVCPGYKVSKTGVGPPVQGSHLEVGDTTSRSVQ